MACYNMAQTSRVTLAPPERKELERRARSRSLAAESVRRAKVILMLAADSSYKEICQRLGCAVHYISRLKKRYEEASGRDLSTLDFWVAFGYWKLACILQGVFHRYAGGAAAGDRSGIDGVAPMILELATTALDVIEGRAGDRAG